MRELPLTFTLERLRAGPIVLGLLYEAFSEHILRRFATFYPNRINI